MNTNKNWLRLLRLLRLTTTNEPMKSGNTGVVESWVLNLKLKPTKLLGFKPRLRVKKLKLWNKFVFFVKFCFLEFFFFKKITFSKKKKKKKKKK